MKMNWKMIVAVLIVLSLIGMALVDARSGGKSGGSRGHSSASYSAGSSSKTSGSISSGSPVVAGLVGTGVAAGASKKKRSHVDDDLIENESENETAEQLPGMGVPVALLSLGLLRQAIGRRRAMKASSR